MFEPLVDLAGTGNGSDHITVDPFAQVPLCGLVPPLQEMVVATDVNSNLFRRPNANGELSEPYQSVSLAVPCRPRPSRLGSGLVVVQCPLLRERVWLFASHGFATMPCLLTTPTTEQLEKGGPKGRHSRP